MVKPGRTFLRCLFDLNKTVIMSHPDHHVHLSVGARSDLAWCIVNEYLEDWNGISALNKGEPDMIVTSDASGSWGCGAFWEEQW